MNDLDITEVNDKDITPLPKDPKEEKRRKKAQEFWSDVCWSESERPVE